MGHKRITFPQTANCSVSLNFDLGKKNEIHYHTWKEYLQNSKIAKFGY